MQIPCFLQLGTNQGEKFINLENALNLINEEIGMVISSSSIYETEPWGYEDKETFLNQIIKIGTQHNPEIVLAKCMDIENRLGRIRTKSGYEPRTIDLDILFYGNSIINKNNLQIPHPRLHERKFVLIPLCDIAPDFNHPIFKNTIQKLLENCTDKGWVKKIKNPSPKYPKKD